MHGLRAGRKEVSDCVFRDCDDRRVLRASLERVGVESFANFIGVDSEPANGRWEIRQDLIGLEKLLENRYLYLSPGYSSDSSNETS